MSSASSQNALAQQTLTRVEEALRENDTACVVQIVQLIRDITAKPDTISTHYLAEIIERDLTVMAKVLRLANTLGYNPEGIEITTVPRAIQAVGFVTIRNLAVSLLLLQNAQQQKNSKECREVSSLAVASGYIAQVLIQRKPVCDPGHAFVCAALRQYGRLLLTTFFIEEYRRALALAPTGSADAAFRQVFDLTPLELAAEVLLRARMPSSILDMLQRLPPSPSGASLRSSVPPLLAVCDFAERLSELVAEKDLGPERFEARAENLARHYRPAVSLSGPAIVNLLGEVRRKLTALGGGLGTGPLVSRIDALCHPPAETETPPAPAPTLRPPEAEPSEMPAVSASPAPDKAAASAAEARGRTPRDVLEEGITEITRLSAQLPVNRRAVFGTAARVVREALALDECWVFWRDDPAAALAARLGDGPRFAAIRDVATVEATRKNVFTVCAESGEIVLIPRPDDPKLRPFIPRWLQPLTETASFVLLPVRNPDGAIAILCGVGKNGQYPGLTAPIRQQISVLSRLLARCCQPSWNAPPLR